MFSFNQALRLAPGPLGRVMSAAAPLPTPIPPPAFTKEPYSPPSYAESSPKNHRYYHHHAMSHHPSASAGSLFRAGLLLWALFRGTEDKMASAVDKKQ